MSPRRRQKDACRFRRKSAGYPIHRRILIVGEGQETEPNYFRGLRREDPARSTFAITVKGAGGRSPEHCVQVALDEVESARHRGPQYRYEEVWCVMDVEGTNTSASLSKAMAAGRKNGIKTCLSNPSFEVWLIAHFERTRKSFINSKAAERHLSGHWRKACGQPYDKADPKVHERVRASTDTAIHNAREVHYKDHGGGKVATCNSSTEVYQLVAMLLAKT